MGLPRRPTKKEKLHFKNCTEAILKKLENHRPPNNAGKYNADRERSGCQGRSLVCRVAGNKNSVKPPARGWGFKGAQLRRCKAQKPCADFSQQPRAGRRACPRVQRRKLRPVQGKSCGWRLSELARRHRAVDHTKSSPRHHLQVLVRADLRSASRKPRDAFPHLSNAP